MDTATPGPSFPVRVDCGTGADPWTQGRVLGETPEIDPTAVIRRSDLGRYTYVGPRSHMSDCLFDDYSYAIGDNQFAHARIGKFCNIATGVRINPSNHPWWRATLHHFTYRSRSYGLPLDDDVDFFAWRESDQVIIGPDVWLGHNAIVMPGVRVGLGAVVGSGAVVTHDVPDFAVVVGVPARVIRQRVDEETAAALKRIAWWEWDHARLAQALPDLRALDAKEFARRYDPR